MNKARLGKNFRCVECKKIIDKYDFFGSAHRNHCPHCGYSVHVDQRKGDRASDCGGKMEPIGLMYKSHNELSIVHRCTICGKINYNRIAADDDAEMIENLLDKSEFINRETRDALETLGITLLGPQEKNVVHSHLYGKS